MLKCEPKIWESYESTFIRRIINTNRSPKNEYEVFFSLTGQLGIFWNSDCKERNAECSKWKQICVCHCDPEYSMTNGHCIQGKIKWMLIYLIQFIPFFICKKHHHILLLHKNKQWLHIFIRYDSKAYLLYTIFCLRYGKTNITCVKWHYIRALYYVLKIFRFCISCVNSLLF